MTGLRRYAINVQGESMIRNMRILATLLSILFVLPCSGGIALADATPSVLKKIQVTGTGNDTRIEISADKPLTYTYYRMPELLKAVIDLAIVDPGHINPVITINSAMISKITVEKKSFYDFSLTRVVINLEKETEFAVKHDPADKGKILVTFGKGLYPRAGDTSGKSVADVAKPADIISPAIEKASQSPLSATTPTAAAALVTADRKAEPGKKEPTLTHEPRGVAPKMMAEQAPAAQSDKAARTVTGPVLTPVVPTTAGARIISALKVNSDNLEICASYNIDDFKAFILTKPERLVIDMPLAKNSIMARNIPVRRLGVARARLGSYPGKVRLVFDTDGKPVPSYKIEKTGKGLKVFFPSRQKVMRQNQH
jgi:type IV pilus assembly protein PilQ